jgi:hypothetical protein
MDFLNKMRDDIESDLLTSTYPTLKNKFKKVIYEDSNLDILIYQKYFGLNTYNIDLSLIYLIDENKQKKQLNYYLFLDDVEQIKFYNKTIIIIDKDDNKRIFKKNYWYKYYYFWNSIKKMLNYKNNILDCYYVEI